MRTLLATLFTLLVAACYTQANAQTGAHTHPDLEAPIADHETRLQGLEGALPSILDRLNVLEGYHTTTPPVDDPPTVTNLGASCEEEAACSGNIGAADDSGSFTVTWGSTALTGFVGQADGSWVAAPVDGDGLAMYSITGSVDDGVNAPVDFTLQVTVNDTIVATPPPVGGNLQGILDMPEGSWLAYGDPWSDLETSGELQQLRDNCNILLSKLITGWQGLAFDGRYFWNLAGPGHSDGCFNGIVRYDLETGTPEVALPHLPLNMPICWGPFVKPNGQTDCYYEPYATTTPAPICATTSDPNCGGLTLQERTDAGLTVWPTADAILAETEGQETFGPFLRPRSSHDYTNTFYLDGYVYLMTGQTYGGIRADGQVWRFAVADSAGTLERLPNRWNPNGGPLVTLPDGTQTRAGDIYGNYNANVVLIPGRDPLMFSSGQVCEADMLAGTYACSPHPISLSNSATAAWDEERQGVWVIDAQFGNLNFLRETDGIWDEDLSLSTTSPLLGGVIGRAGLCIVPTETGTNPVVWGANATLMRWDGTALTEVTGQVGQPATAASTVLGKWRWNDDLGVCIGLTEWIRGADVWRPDFSNWQEASNPPDPEEDPQPGTWPTFAGHELSPAPFTPAAWNEPIERQPEAPDYDALCPGEWAELNYRTQAEVTSSGAQTRGLVSSGKPNVRIYLHPREDAPEPYAASVIFDRVQCGELVGVPANGNRPETIGDVALDKSGTGLIVRGIDFLEDGSLGWACHQPSQACPAFTVLHDNRMGGLGLVGDADPSLPQTYLELRGNFFGPNLDWHGIYLERSIGKLVALGNVFHASGNAGHALKNLANYARIEGNILSNVGLDGQPLQRGGNDVIGLFSLDHYACTDSIIRNNTIVFRTSGNVATLLTLRGRNAWGNCDKGARLADGSRPVWSPESPEYLDETRWAEIATAADDFALGYEVARENPELFTHLIEGNTFIVFEAHSNVPRALTVHSMRPIADNTIESALKAEMEALFVTCGAEPDYDVCWFANASPELLYVHEHIEESRRFVMRHGNGQGRVEVPNSLPIRAPANWVERTGVYWDENQTYIACNDDGSQCAERGPYTVEITQNPWDDVPLASPPRVMSR